jgi:hypothetical protein
VDSQVGKRAHARWQRSWRGAPRDREETLELLRPVLLLAALRESPRA